MIKHYAYPGHWVYYVIDTVYITDVHGNVTDQWPATESDKESFIISKKKHEKDSHDGMVLMHDIIPQKKKKKKEKKKEYIPKAVQMVLDGTHPMFPHLKSRKVKNSRGRSLMPHETRTPVKITIPVSANIRMLTPSAPT